MLEEKGEIKAVHETHTEFEENLRSRGTMPGYVFIGTINSSIHGIATYVEDSFSYYRVLYQDHSYDVLTLTV
jgi:hypothetical protein